MSKHSNAQNQSVPVDIIAIIHGRMIGAAGAALNSGRLQPNETRNQSG
jgi:hypothetical protein